MQKEASDFEQNGSSTNNADIVATADPSNETGEQQAKLLSAVPKAEELWRNVAVKSYLIYA